MQSAVDSTEKCNPEFSRLLSEYEASVVRMRSLNRRRRFLRNPVTAPRRLAEFERLAEREVDNIVRIADRMSALPAKNIEELRAKGAVLRWLVEEDDTAVLADKFVQSLCRDLTS